jgi:GEVED domain/Secretion system C-terminal sorting domain/Metallo-peptidase family M12B Reprolysin-like
VNLKFMTFCQSFLFCYKRAVRPNYMKFFFHTIAFLLCLPVFISAQAISCGTPTPNLEEMLRQEAQLKRSPSGTFRATTYLAIKPHLIRRTNGTGGVSEADFNGAIAKANNYFANSEIRFYIVSTGFHYINNDTYYNFNSNQEAALCSANDVNNAINIYCARTITKGSGSPIGGYAYLPTTSNSSNRVFIANGQVNDNKLTVHELGHYFSLLHTFENNNIAGEGELVTRGAGANCTTKGDLLCETAADPYDLPNATMSGCTYTGNQLDQAGELYAPTANDLANIMGYHFCNNILVPEQYARIKNTGLMLRTLPANAYTLNAAPAVLADVCPTVTINGNGLVGGTSVSLSWTTVAGASGYFIERSTDNVTYKALAGVNALTSNYTDVTAMSNTAYYYRIIPSNTYTTGCNTMMPSTLLYCKPTYTLDCAGGSPYASIENFTLFAATPLSNLASGCSYPFTGGFTNMSTDVIAGATYTFILDVATEAAGYWLPQHIGIWLDNNHNGTFEDTAPGVNSEMLFQTSGSTVMASSNTLSGTITIPSNASIGMTRLRIRSQDASNGEITDPCIDYIWGEAEDYALNIMSVLPIRLTKIHAEPTAAKKVKLDWTTAAEYNNDGFIVQYSLDGIHFIDLERVASHGNTNTAQNYSFLHQNPNNGVNFYRLKQVDRDAKEDYSPIVSATIDGKTIGSAIYPNPMQGNYFFVKLGDTQSENINIRCYDASGRFIHLDYNTNVLSEPLLKVNTESNLASGIYFVEITTNQSHEVIRLMME